MGNLDSVKEGEKGAEDDEDVPELVGTNFEEASKQWRGVCFWECVSQRTSLFKT